MAIPVPGQPVRGSLSGKPIMALLDLLGRTWALGVIWQLHKGPSTFRELQSRCEQISPSLLNTRIKELIALKLVEKHDSGYRLSQQGKDLYEIIAPLGDWSKQWAKEVANKSQTPLAYRIVCD